MICCRTSEFMTCTGISIGIRAGILFCLWMRSEGRYFLVHEQGRRLLLKSCLDLKKFIWLCEWSLEVEDGLFWCCSLVVSCSCVRFDLFSNLWYFGVTWSMMLGLICDTWRFWGVFWFPFRCIYIWWKTPGVCWGCNPLFSSEGGVSQGVVILEEKFN